MMKINITKNYIQKNNWIYKKSKRKEKSSIGEDEESKKLDEELSDYSVSEKPNIKWNDIADLDKSKEVLKETVVLSIQFPQLFQGKKQQWKGMLLNGPPGTKKSFLVKEEVTETRRKFFSV